MIDINDYMKKSKSERQLHVNLSETCSLRNTYSLELRGLLAYYLDTNVPRGHSILLGHACNNPDCSNPKHLYWATKSDNEVDKHLNNDKIKLKISKSLKGARNSNFQIKPWMANNAHMESWSKAQYLYENYYSKNWDYKKYGHGIQYFNSKYNIAVGSGKCMLRMFREGWVPSLDTEWTNTFKKDIDETHLVHMG
jgi:hypothetical protein